MSFGGSKVLIINPNMRRLNENERFQFPNPKTVKGNVIAMGGNLSAGMLLSAYERGIFPWEELVWHSPDPRFVIFPNNLCISSSMKKILNRKTFEVYFDRDFLSVITNCANIYRQGQGGTWISPQMINAYVKLHDLGFAHSSESYIDGELVGGCYGIRLGNIFFGESMFAKVSNASKAAFLTLAKYLFNKGIEIIDCQVYTKHLESLGACEIERAAFLDILSAILSKTHPHNDCKGKWNNAAL